MQKFIRIIFVSCVLLLFFSSCTTQNNKVYPDLLNSHQGILYSDNTRFLLAFVTNSKFSNSDKINLLKVDGKNTGSFNWRFAIKVADPDNNIKHGGLYLHEIVLEAKKKEDGLTETLNIESIQISINSKKYNLVAEEKIQQLSLNEYDQGLTLTRGEDVTYTNPTPLGVSEIDNPIEFGYEALDDDLTIQKFDLTAFEITELKINGEKVDPNNINKKFDKGEQILISAKVKLNAGIPNDSKVKTSKVLVYTLGNSVKQYAFLTGGDLLYSPSKYQAKYIDSLLSKQQQQ